jgi:hypothetical protein
MRHGECSPDFALFERRGLVVAGGMLFMRLPGYFLRSIPPINRSFEPKSMQAGG